MLLLKCYVAGSAKSSGMVELGDIVYVIDQTCVLRHSKEEILARLHGPEYSICSVIFLRGEQRIPLRLIRRATESRNAILYNPVFAETNSSGSRQITPN